MDQYLPYVLPVFGIVLGLGLTWIVALVIRKLKFNENETLAINAFKSSVMSTYRSSVKPWKDKQKGKLTHIQKEEALAIAKQGALSLLTGAGKKFMLAMWDSRKNQIIESIVSKFKKDGSK